MNSHQKRRAIVRELWRGKSIGRILLNLMVAKHVQPQGKVIDLGGGASPSYWRFLPPANSANVVSLDLDEAARPSVVASLERPLPLAAGAADTVFLFNVLEHIYRHRELMMQIRRLLTQNGRLYLWVPFLVAIHGHPHDYFRYTETTLTRLLQECGFTAVRVRPAGGLILAVTHLLEPLWRWRPLRLLAGLVAFGLEAVLPRQYRRQAAARWPVGYFVSATVDEGKSA